LNTKGREMTKFLVTGTAMLALLVVGLVTYNTLDATRTLNRSLEKTKEQIVNEAVNTIRINSAGVANLAEIPGIYDYFNPSFIASYSAGYLQPVYNLIAYLSRPLFNVDAVTVSVNGTQVASSLTSDVRPSDVPPPPAPGEHTVLSHLGTQQGYFVSCAVPIALPGTQVTVLLTMISDRTAEITAAQNTFTAERNNLVNRQLLVDAVAILVSIALALLGVRFLGRRYIAGPINRLLTTARHVMEGGYKNPIIVTPGERLRSPGSVTAERADHSPQDGGEPGRVIGGHLPGRVHLSFPGGYWPEASN